MAATFYASLAPQQRHSHGAIIVSGQAQGKTHWSKSEPSWVDADLLLGQYPPSQVESKAADVEELVKLGAWVLSSTWWKLADFGHHVAVVCVPPAELKARAKLKSFEFEDAASQASTLREAAGKANVPVFSSFDAAKSHLIATLSAEYSQNRNK